MDSATKDIIVGVGDLRVSDDSNRTIVTYALGSCVGVTAYDPVKKIGGMLHAMLPAMRNESDKKRLAMYVDSGMQELFNSLQGIGVLVGRLEFKVFGAARVLDADKFFKIGEKNIKAMEGLATQNNLKVLVWEVGGNVNRTIKFHLNTGKVNVRMPNQPEFER